VQLILNKRDSLRGI
jgi:hypothetical protein